MSSPISGVMLMLLLLILRVLDVEVPPRPSDLQACNGLFKNGFANQSIFHIYDRSFTIEKEKWQKMNFWPLTKLDNVKFNRHLINSLSHKKHTYSSLWSYLQQTMHSNWINQILYLISHIGETGGFTFALELETLKKSWKKIAYSFIW